MDRPFAQAPRHGRRLVPHRVGLDLLVAGLTTGLLTLAGAALIGASPANDPGAALSCTAFEVGSPRAASTHIYLYNAGSERAGARLDFVDHEGRDSQAIGYTPILDPSESSEFVFRTPALGATVKLATPGRNLQARVELHFEDGAVPEIRTPIQCLPGAGDEEIDRTPGATRSSANVALRSLGRSLG
jgi:hypothetical protein